MRPFCLLLAATLPVSGLSGGVLAQNVPPAPPAPPEAAQGGPALPGAAAGGSPGSPVPAPGGGPSPQSGDLPKPFPISRYQALLEKSPFAIATAAPEPVAPTENFATNWVLGGLSKSKSKEGTEEYVVIVRSRDLSTRLVLKGDKPSDDGVSVVSVEEAPVAAKSVVILKKGSETGRVEFDQSAVAASPLSAAPAPGQISPGGKPSKTSAAAAPAVPRPAIPRPGMGGTVPRPGASVGAPAPAAPNGASGLQDARRRVRPIPASPGASETPNP